MKMMSKCACSVSLLDGVHMRILTDNSCPRITVHTRKHGVIFKKDAGKELKVKLFSCKKKLLTGNTFL